jgi:hypothetical protein
VNSREPAGPRTDPVTKFRREVEALDVGFFMNLRAFARRGVEEHLVEVRALDLIGVGVARAKAVLEKERQRSRPAGRSDFTAVFREITGIHNRSDAEPIKGAHAVWQKGFADVKARKLLALEDHSATPLHGQQGRGRAAGRPPPMIATS